jgi:predicted alpha/beta superfamily hydrolase
MEHTHHRGLLIEATPARTGKVVAALFASMLALFSCASYAAQVSAPVNIGSCTIIESKVLHEPRKYCVHLPPSYAYAGSAQRRYPVLYMLDGENFFVSAADVTDFMSAGVNGNYAIPEMIVIGVNNTSRTRDLTPSHSLSHSGGTGDLSSSGGGAAFLSFLDQELIPQVEHDYRTMPYRILAGHSLAGLTAINAFQNKPQMFQATIAIDPSLWWDGELMLKEAKASPSAGTGSNRLYVALANSPSIDGIYAHIASTHMNAIRAYAQFMEANTGFRPRFKLDYFPAEEHGSVPLIALYGGLQFIFENYKLTFAEGLNHPEHINEHFEKVSATLGARFLPPEQLVNVMGYMALNDLKDPAKAIALFSLNTANYPQSANAYDSLGEVCAATGKKEQAIESYEKSVELNPGNTNGKMWLQKLRGQ